METGRAHGRARRRCRRPRSEGAGCLPAGSHGVRVPLSGLLVVVGLLGMAAVGCGPEVRPAEIAAATDSIREMYMDREYRAGVRFGERWSDRAPDAAELRAWHVLHLTREAGNGRVLEEARALAREASGSPWTDIARAASLAETGRDGAKARRLSERAFRAAPPGSTSDFAWIRAEVLREAVGEERAVEYVRALPDSLRRRPPVLNREALSHYRRVHAAGDPTRADSLRTLALRRFEEARRADSTNVNARYLPGVYLLRQEPGRALPLLRRAAELSASPELTGDYLHAVWRDPGRSPEAKRARVRAGVDSLLARHPESPAALGVAARSADRIGAAGLRDSLESRIWEDHARSEAAARLLETRISRLRDTLEARREEGEVGGDLRREYLRTLNGLLDHPAATERQVASAHRTRFRFLARRDSADPGRLREATRGALRHHPFSYHLVRYPAVLALTEHTTDYGLAERVARTGLDSAAAAANRFRDFHDTAGELVRSVNSNLGMMLDGLGWIAFHRDSLDRARELLLRAEERDPGPRLLYHLGRTYERLDSLDRAEQVYSRATLLDTGPVRGVDNPADTALKRLYRERNGGLEGWADYYAGLEERQAERHREQVLESRIENPRPMPDFRLATLDGDPVSLDELRGSVAVVHAWGMWCGPCLAELPEFQRLWEKYRDDPDVRVLSIDTRDNPDELREWMDEKGYTFPVALDDGYLQGIGHSTYPMTWFLNREGEVVFTKRGASRRLLESFSWRVEALGGSAGD